LKVVFVSSRRAFIWSIVVLVLLVSNAIFCFRLLSHGERVHIGRDDGWGVVMSIASSLLLIGAVAFPLIIRDLYRAGCTAYGFDPDEKCELVGYRFAKAIAAQQWSDAYAMFNDDLVKEFSFDEFLRECRVEFEHRDAFFSLSSKEVVPPDAELDCRDLPVSINAIIQVDIEYGADSSVAVLGLDTSRDYRIRTFIREWD